MDLKKDYPKNSFETKIQVTIFFLLIFLAFENESTQNYNQILNANGQIIK